MMTHRRAYCILFALIALIYIPCFVTFLSLDQKIDWDGNPAYSFPVHGGDSPEYIILAENLIQHRTFSPKPNEPFTPETFRTPGYPLFLAATLFLFGSYKVARVKLRVRLAFLLFLTFGSHESQPAIY